MTDPAYSSPRTPHDELRWLAEAATPGPWHTGDDPATSDGVWADIPTGEDYDEGLTYLVAWFHGDWRRDDDAAFVAAANPATILALLAELAEARRLVLADADNLADEADAYIEAVQAYLDPENQFTESRRHAVQAAQERLGRAISVVQNIE